MRSSAWILVAAVAGCGGGGGGDDGGNRDAPAADAPVFTGRPYELFVPPGYVAGTPTPLVVLLHGYGATALTQEAYFQFKDVARTEIFLYAMPDGTVDGAGKQFWNATDACCDADDRNPDDSGYLRSVIEDVAAHYTVDPKRIYFVGHSNGGFMSHRMACDHADRIAAVVSLAGATWNDPSRCSPAAPVAVAHVHGDADAVVNYNGGIFFAAYPSAPTTMMTWAAKNGCGGTTSAPAIDLVANLAGAETTIERATGCTAGGASELWTIQGGDHIPSFNQTWAPTVWAFFEAHPKP